MRKALALTLGLTISITSWGQASCPLTNSKLTDLRTAASKLATTITMSPECQSYEKNINDANANLKAVADQIQKYDTNSSTTTTASDKPDPKTLALTAVTQLNTINSVFNNQKCGQQLAGFLDYADTFIDVVNGMVPFLALYGGPGAAPWVLGPAVGGAAAKAVISFFKNKSLDMRKPEQSNAFIKNSCAFYNLNQIKLSLDDLQLNQEPRLASTLAKAKEDLSQLQKSLPSSPDNGLSQLLRAAGKDETELKYLQDRFKEDPVEACTYMKAFAKAEDGRPGLVARSWQIYDESVEDKSFNFHLEDKYFHEQLNPAIASGDLTKCKDSGVKWLNKLQAFNTAGLVALRKKAENDTDLKTYVEKQTQLEREKSLVETLEAQVKLFTEMTGSGFNIEYSEIIRSHRQIQDSLFDSYRYLAVMKMRGLAEAWLKVKQEDANTLKNEFSSRKAAILNRLKTIRTTIGSKDDLSRSEIIEFANQYKATNNHEHAVVTTGVLSDVCNELRNTWSAWYNSLIHARAGRDYCVVFDNVINHLDYPDVQKMCFGTVTETGRNVHSLKNLVSELNALKPQADDVRKEMQKYDCRESVDVTQDLLRLPLQ